MPNEPVSSLPAISAITDTTLLLAVNTSSPTYVSEKATGLQVLNYVVAGAGFGNVFGPGSSTDSHVVKFDGTTGKLIKDGGALGSLAVLSSINNSNWSGTALAVANGGTGSTTASAARTALGLAIGTDVQAFNVNLTTVSGYGSMANITTVVSYGSMANLTAIAGLTTAADKVSYWTGSGTATTTNFTSIGRSIVGGANAAAVQATLSLVPGTDVEIEGQVTGINTQTASYTLALTDKGKIVEMNVAGANNLTIPANATVAFPVNSRIDVVQYGAGQTTFVAAGGVTIRSYAGNLKMIGQYTGASLYKRATDEWVLVGSISA